MKVYIALYFTFIAIISCNANEEEGNFFEGDMELNPEQMAAIREQDQKGNTYASVKSYHWKTDGQTDRINYYINPAINGARTAISQAIADYERFTCIRFQRLSYKPSGPHLYFTTGTGCSSPVGRNSNGNWIKLARGCWRKGTVMHEIGHSLGFYHEQSRPDRDRFVRIIWGNIRSGKSGNFRKISSDRIDSLGTDYDYNSMMHYGKAFFGINRRMTIQTLDPSKQNVIGQRNGFSQTDITQLRRMYCA